MAEAFDYIIVGAGSSGAVLAARLSEQPGVRVLLLEAGGSHHHWSVEMPLGIGLVLENRNRTWDYQTIPQRNLFGRQVEQPRGRMLGGTSSINGMVWSRGHPEDFDSWASEFGCSDWSSADVMPYFRRAERHERGSTPFRGGDGPIAVTAPPLAEDRLARAFIDSGRMAGYPVTSDSNAFQQEGFGPNERTIQNGRRISTAKAYLESASRRSNLTIWKHAHATRVIMDGLRAKGVEFSRHGVLRQANCKREVILSSGAFGSPQLLMLSGIGPANHLSALGIASVKDLPGVGANLHDHAEVLVQRECARAVSLYHLSRGIGRLRAGIQWFLSKTGPAATNHFHAAAFLRSAKGIKWPDIKLELFPIAYGPDLQLLPESAYQVHIGLMRPKSRGTLKLVSTDPMVAPAIDLNLLDDPEDATTLERAVRLVREILEQPPIAELSGREISPGPNCSSMADFQSWIRATVRGAYHPVGSCRMGRSEDPLAVVDSVLRVRGIEGLRVVDASVMPRVTNANTSAACVMIAERASDLILGLPPLERDVESFWLHPNWKQAQR